MGRYYSPEEERQHAERARRITDDDTSEFELAPIRPARRRDRMPRPTTGASGASSSPTEETGSTLSSIRPKVAAVALAGAITTILMYVLHETLGVNPPPEVVAAITAVIAFIGGYLQPDG